MPDRLEPEEREHPVAAGLLALLGVALVVGLIMGLGALAGAQVLGLGESTSSATNEGEATMYLPKPEKTKADNGPEITLAPGEETSADTDGKPKEEETTEKKPKKVISLSLSQSSVSPMEQIDLTGVYPGGEGAILQVERFENGAWADFPVTVTVSDETFSTYVQTGISGEHRFRVIDTSTGKASNEVRVTVG